MGRTVASCFALLALVVLACTNQSASKFDIPRYAIFHGSRDVFEVGGGAYVNYNRETDESLESEVFLFAPRNRVERELRHVRDNLESDGWQIVSTPESGSGMFKATAADGAPCVRYVSFDSDYEKRIATDELLSQIDRAFMLKAVEKYGAAVAAVVSDSCTSFPTA